MGVFSDPHKDTKSSTEYIHKHLHLLAFLAQISLTDTKRVDSDHARSSLMAHPLQEVPQIISYVNTIPTERYLLVWPILLNLAPCV